MEAADVPGAPHAEVYLGRAPRSPRGVAFVLGKESVRDVSRHRFDGNIRELELFVTNAVVFALTDALEAVEQGRAATGDAARIVPIPARLVRELLGGGAPRRGQTRGQGRAETRSFRVAPADGLHEVARALEQQLYEGLFAETGGDFEAMARMLLGRDDAVSARRVRLRFNQLGLRVRGRRAGAVDDQ